MWVDLRSLWEPTRDAALTGASATFAQGTVAPDLSVALSGQAITSSTGTLAADNAVALAGQAATFSAGTLAPANAVPLTGQAGTFSAGTLAPDATVPLTGTGLTFAAGTLAPATDVALSGALATFAAGTITAGSDVATALTGTELSFATGTMVAVVSGTTPDQPSGGYETALERQIHRRRLRREREEALAQEAREQAPDPVQAELASLLHEQIARQEQIDELQRLKAIVAKRAHANALPDRVKAAFDKAKADASFSHLQALEREYMRMLEEEEIAVLMTLSLLD